MEQTEELEYLIGLLAKELAAKPEHIRAVIRLLDEGATAPFIARYRKEQHGGMDDQAIRLLAERLEYLRGLAQRRRQVKEAIEAQEALTPALAAAIDAAATLAEVEDLYLPYRPKRRTRASAARERGLAPLAQALRQGQGPADPAQLAAPYLCPEKGVETPEQALAGAQDIIAEELAEDAALRKRLRTHIRRTGALRSKAAGEEDTVYRLYYDFTEKLSRLKGYQTLALNRGEREQALKISIEPDEAGALQIVRQFALRPSARYAELIRQAAEDSWKRLLFPSLEREARAELTETAQEQAIRAFAANLRPLLMQPPVRGKTVLALDPGYRAGCKLAAVDPFGHVLETGVIYPTKPYEKTAEAKAALRRLCDKHHVDCFAIGNGTASRETEIFAAEFIREYGGNLSYMVVSEAGASVYSASPLAAQEFPDFDVTLRSAVSIARRFQDPLAELVKIDPKSIGVGQYQHDMPQARLSQALDGVVEDCVNAVGVDLNAASPALLERIAGVSGAVAKNIAAYRQENGPFPNRKALLKVAKLGPKTFEQCAGFLRIPGGENLLDNTAVHPESYPAAKALLDLCGFSLADAGKPAMADLPRKLKEIGLETAAARCGVGLPTLLDIVEELQKPGRDPRDQLPPPLLRTDVLGIEDLKPGMQLPGVGRNVADFGAFVDIGVHQDGLVHISQLSDRFIRHPSEVVAVGDQISVSVLEVDIPKRRISLSAKTGGHNPC